MRCLKIINGKRNNVKIPLIRHTRSKICAIEVLKCLKGVSPPDYENYCKCLDHCKGTRGNNQSLLLPNVKSEAGRKTLHSLLL